MPRLDSNSVFRALFLAFCLMHGGRLASALPPTVEPSSTTSARVPTVASATGRFLRLIEPQGARRGRLETAWIVYRSSSGPDVAMCAVAHCGEAAYYRRLQARLDRCQFVLYEAIGMGNDDSPPIPNPEMAAHLAPILKQTGLVSQAAHINYERKNFRWADMDAGTLLEKEAANLVVNVGQDLLSLAATSVGSLAQSVTTSEPSGAQNKGLGETLDALVEMMGDGPVTPASAARARRQLALGLVAGMGEVDAQLGRTLTRLLITSRNERVVQVLDEVRPQATKGVVALFYGGGHMPDLEMRLRSRGYTQHSTQWEIAWEF